MQLPELLKANKEMEKQREIAVAEYLKISTPKEVAKHDAEESGEESKEEEEENESSPNSNSSSNAGDENANDKKTPQDQLINGK